jgi:nucleoside-diphosphate-sugar epimerase
MKGGSALTHRGRPGPYPPFVGFGLAVARGTGPARSPLDATMSRLLITGATGFVGMEVLARYLERGEEEVTALVRAGSDAEAQARMNGVLENLFGPVGARAHAGRVEGLAAELTAPELGLSAARRRELAASVGAIVHSAASVSFTLPLAQARAINVLGTERLLDLASEVSGLEHFAHISTAYVAGTHAGRFGEPDFDLGQGFRNSYERSKYEAEEIVRARPEIPFSIIRPSIVVGDRRSGWTAAFNVLYWPLRAFARAGRRRLGRLRGRCSMGALPGRAGNRPDLSPGGGPERDLDGRARRCGGALLQASRPAAARWRRPGSRRARRLLPLLLGRHPLR